MKKLVILLLAFFSLATVFGQNIPPKPDPPRLVNDLSGTLSSDQVAALERKLVALDDSSSNQVAIVLVKTIGDNDIQDYATKLFRAWGIGNKKTNNGVLIVAAIDDRKVRIEVGYGLEGAIPDITADAIIHNEIAPRFKEGNYYQGLSDAADALSKAAVGEYKVKREREVQSSKGRGGSGGSIFTFIIIIIVILGILGRGRGGGSGGRGGGMGGLAEGLIIGSLLGGGRGGGGGWGGGDSGGGGFGGFGGGSSGGGGASGSW